VFKPASPHSIISNGARGPYAHFLFPVCGFDRGLACSSTSEESSNRHVQGESNTFLPDVRLSSQNEKTADTKSPEGKRVTLRETVVALPPATSNKPSSSGSRASSQKEVPIEVKGLEVKGQEVPPKAHAMHLLGKIPDFSFMLSSKLSLPRDPASS
jgi:hypothetical protein